MKTKGFTLIELLVVIVIIGILVAIALPNFIKIKDKAKEAEVKQNLHAIQLALERYSTDEDGTYPYYLYGGEALFNIGSANGVNTSGYGTHINYQAKTIHPFDMFAAGISGVRWDYSKANWNDMRDRSTDLQNTFGDSLAYEGYMPKYPGNPFAVGTSALRTFGMDAIQWNWAHYYCWGGEDGHKMVNIGWLSELPHYIMFENSTATTDFEEIVKLELPGNFSYHARWSDGITNTGHLRRQSPDYNPAGYVPSAALVPLDDSAEVSTLDVAGYDLTAVGSPRTRGDDLDTPITITGYPQHHWRTGYLTQGQERNPHVQTGDYPNVEDFDERPTSDGVPDFIIIHLASGIDKKVGNPTDDN